MSTQPEALFLADVIDNDPCSKAHHNAAAAELRRLAEIETLYRAAMRGRHKMSEAILALTAQRDALLEACKAMLEQFNYSTITGIVHDESAAIAKARAAIKAAEEGK